MIEQIENINWLGRCVIFEYDQFIDYIGLRSEWSKKHEYSNDDQNHVWYFIKKGQYTLLSLSNLCLIQSLNPVLPVSLSYCLDLGYVAV